MATSDAEDHINARADIDYVIHCGDLTDWGYESEYILAHNHLREFNKPFLTVVGNHDHISQNSSSLFRSMFGSLNWSFEFLGRKFIFFDNNLGDVPGFDQPWLEAELNDAMQFDQAFLVNHAPTFSFTFGKNP